MKKLVTIAACFAVLSLGTYALADRIFVVVDSTSTIDHGDWTVLPDAGFRYTVCGTALLSDGGVAGFLQPCEFCEPGSWGAAPAICVLQWRTGRTR